MNEFIKINEGGLSVYLLETLATKDELIDYAIRSCAPLEVVENLEELESRTTNTTKNKPSMDTIGTINFLIA